jgi:ribosome biogenesis protein ENP2
VGSAALKPYMHGYFISLKLYDTARVIANPFAYAEYREKMVREKMEKMAETRIRTKKDVQVKVNKALAEKILREAERDKKKADKKKKQKEADKGEGGTDVDHEEDHGRLPKKNLLSDPRFKAVFEDPEYVIDVNSREYALLNPSGVAQMERGKTAVEDEEDESDKVSSDGLEDSDESGSGSDSSEAGGQCILFVCHITFVNHAFDAELNKFDPRMRPGQRNPRLEAAHSKGPSTRVAKVNLVPMRADARSRGVDKDATFGQRRKPASAPGGRRRKDDVQMHVGEDGAMEMTWTPSTSQVAPGDSLFDDSDGTKNKKKSTRGGEMFGAGMEKGVVEQAELSEMERKGRTQRRKGVRSGSKNVFRSLK